MKKIFVILAFFVPALAFAQDVPLTDWLAQVFQAVQGFGGLQWAAKVMLICSLLVGSMKVTALRDLLWNKLGGLKFLASPMIAMIGGVVSLWAVGHTPTMAEVSAYFLAGLGGNLLKDLLENVKQIPGIGAGVVKAIDMVEALMAALKIGRAQ